MTRSLLVFALCAALSAASLSAQTPGPSPAAEASACPSTATLDLLIKAIDDAVSGPANKDRTCFRALFLPDARLAPLAHAADGSYAPHILNVDGWIDAVSKRGSAVLSEHQIKVKTETWGHIAHLWSTYELHVDPAGSPVIRGINSIQAVYDGKQWKVFQIFWQAETPAEPIPEKYLP